MKKSLIITGAGGNLGRTVTQRMLNLGYALEATLGPHDKADFIAHDALRSEKVNLLDETAAAEFVSQVKSRCDVLSGAILLVGGFTPGGFKESDAAAIDKMINLNFKTAYFMIRPLLEVFEEQQNGGRIILIGTRPVLNISEGKNLIAYSLSKSLLFKLAEYINSYGSKFGITVTVIVPSTLDTPGTRSAMPDADFSKWVPTEQVADTIEFILSEAGGMMRETVIKLYNKA